MARGNYLVSYSLTQVPALINVQMATQGLSWGITPSADAR